eukprot:8878769-Heterocapsa_arctica.AAC.1
MASEIAGVLVPGSLDPISVVREMGSTLRPGQHGAQPEVGSTELGRHPVTPSRELVQGPVELLDVCK